MQNVANSDVKILEEEKAEPIQVAADEVQSENEHNPLEENQEEQQPVQEAGDESPERGDAQEEPEVDLECHEEAVVAQEDEEQQQYVIERQSVIHD